MSKLARTIAAAMLTAAVAASAAPATPAADAGGIYEWVDAAGKVHASDAVPEQYKGVARRLDPGRYWIPAGEQADAERQAATLKSNAASATPAAASTAARSGPAPAASPSRRVVADSPACAAWRRRMAATPDCFMSVTGPNGVSVLHSCSNEPDPEPACGPDAAR